MKEACDTVETIAIKGLRQENHATTAHRQQKLHNIGTRYEKHRGRQASNDNSGTHIVLEQDQTQNQANQNDKRGQTVKERSDLIAFAGKPVCNIEPEY